MDVCREEPQTCTFALKRHVHGNKPGSGNDRKGKTANMLVFSKIGGHRSRVPKLSNSLHVIAESKGLLHRYDSQDTDHCLCELDKVKILHAMQAGGRD